MTMTCGVLPANNSTRYRLWQSVYAQPLSSQSPLSRDPEVFIDTDVSMKARITATVRLCFAALEQVRSVQHSLPQQALLTLIRSLIVSKVDYCCSMLASIPSLLLDRFQSVLNAAARLIFSAQQSDHITLLLCDLHELHVPKRITVPTLRSGFLLPARHCTNIRR